MASFLSQEHRPLKRKREEKGNLGAPDVFPQDKNQKEDELSSDNVKKGFQALPVFQDDTEYGSFGIRFAQTHSHNMSHNLEAFNKRLRDSFLSILGKKADNNVISDKGDRKKVMSKDNFWNVTNKNEVKKDGWFKDLAGTKPLEKLSQSVPILNVQKKEDVFVTLCKFNVPLLRAAWYIKMNHQYLVTLWANQPRKKERDPSQEWTASIIKFLRDQLVRLSDYYNENPLAPVGSTSIQVNSTSSSSAEMSPGSGVTCVSLPPASSPGNLSNASGAGGGDSAPAKDVETELAFKHWNYCIRLGRFMLDEALLDKYEFLDRFLLDLLEKLKPSEDGLLRFFMPLLLQYVDEYVFSELLCRRLAYFCAKRLAMFCDQRCVSPRVSSPLLPSGTASQTRPATPLLLQNPVASIFAEYSDCPLHRPIVLGLSCCIQNIALRCPSGLVWNYLGEGKSQHSVFSGSPLDLLPCPPSSLPMPASEDAPHIRAQLLVAERDIVSRGRAAEGRWSTDKCQQSPVGSTVSRVLAALDALDRHHFDKWDDSFNLEILYRKIFEPDSFSSSAAAAAASELGGPSPDDEPIVNLLCEWAVSVYRTGEHRALAVAKILEKRQNKILYPAGGVAAINGDAGCDAFGGGSLGGDDVSGGAGNDTGAQDGMAPQVVGGTPVFQHLLFNFLDTQAPTLDESPSRENRTAFANLVSLFTELVRHDVFSHDAYICALIARGDLVSGGVNGAIPLYQSATKMHLDGGGLSLGDNPSSVRSALDISGGPRSLQGAGLGAATPGDSDVDFMSPAGAGLIGGATPDPMGPSSVKSDRGCIFNDPLSAPPPSSVTSVTAGHSSGGASVGRPPRHLMYALHFPIPQDESTLHETNQRLLVLYGVGSGREQANKTVKKANKELVKLFGKKNCHDISGDGGKTKKKKHGGAGWLFL